MPEWSHEPEDFCEHMDQMQGVGPGHCGCMDERVAIKYMRQLHDFLTGLYVQTGHPHEDKEKDLENALTTAITDIRGQAAALLVIKTALADGGWLMEVLRDHASDPEFNKVAEVCLKLRDTFPLRTSESRASDDCPHQNAHLTQMLDELLHVY
jgi:hypothetical protein